MDDQLEPDGYKALLDVVAEYEQWLGSMRMKGLISYEDHSVAYVGPGADASTEDLRALVRLYYDRSAEVPEDEIAGGELFIQGDLPSYILWVLGSQFNDE